MRHDMSNQRPKVVKTFEGLITFVFYVYLMSMVFFSCDICDRPNNFQINSLWFVLRFHLFSRYNIFKRPQAELAGLTNN